MTLSGGSNGAMGEAEEQTLFTRQGATKSDLDVGETNQQMGGTKKKWYPKVGKPSKLSILIGFSIINHLFWGASIFGNTQIGGGKV